MPRGLDLRGAGSRFSGPQPHFAMFGVLYMETKKLTKVLLTFWVALHAVRRPYIWDARKSTGSWPKALDVG